MQFSPPVPAPTLNGHGAEAGQHLIALVLSLALFSSSMVLPAKGEEHNPAAVSQQNAASTAHKSEPSKLPVIPNLPVPEKVEGGKKATGTKSAAATEPVLDPTTDPKGVIDQALKAYKTGHYGQAATAILAQRSAGQSRTTATVHYYMGLALKETGHGHEGAQ